MQLTMPPTNRLQALIEKISRLSFRRRRHTLIYHLTKTPDTLEPVRGLHKNSERLVIALTASVVTGAGLLVPIFSVVGGALVAYGIIDLSVEVARTIWREKRIRANLLQVAFSLGLLGAGLPFLAATSLLSYNTGFWFIRRTKDRTMKRLTAHYSNQPQYALQLMQGDGQVEQVVPLSDLRRGDVVRVYAGNGVPVDGVVVGGEAQVDQQSLTGESRLIDFEIGDSVLSSALVVSGYLDIRSERTGDEMVVAQIEQMIEDAQNYREQVEARASGIADATVLPTLGTALVSGVFLGPVVAYNVVMANDMNLLRLAVSLGLLNYLEVITKAGVFIKDGRALERLSDVDTIVFDKTGTLTYSQPSLYDITTFAEMDTDSLLALAASIEAYQQHPIASAISQAATDRDLTLPDIEQITVLSGSGIQANYQGRTVRIGNERLLRRVGAEEPDGVQALRAAAEKRGGSLIYVMLDEQLYGIMELQQTIRPETAEVIAQIRERGLRVVLMSGDEMNATAYLAEQAGIDEVIAEVLPQDKGRLVKQWQSEGRSLAFIGDGINDAVALSTAHVSMTLQGATSIATNSAQIVLLDDDLHHILYLLDTAKQYQKDLTVNAGLPVVGTVAGIGLVIFGGIGFVGTYILYFATAGLTFASVMRPRLRKPRS